MKMIDYRSPLAVRGCTAACLGLAVLSAACSTSNPRAIDYKSDTRVVGSTALLEAPPQISDERPTQRSVPPAGGTASLSVFQEAQKRAQMEAPMRDVVLPSLPGMHVQRDGAQRWLVVEHQSPARLWPQVRRFWLQQGFLLSVDQRDHGIMETDWKETHASLNQGIIRNVLTLAIANVGNAYVTGERTKFRTRLEAGPNGSTYVFVTEIGLREMLTGPNNESSTWQQRPNDPGLEAEYLRRLMAALARQDGGGAAGVASTGGAATVASGIEPASAVAAASESGTPLPAPTPAAPDVSSGEARGNGGLIELAESYEQVWQRVGAALERANFTLDGRDPEQGIYILRYVDPTDITAEQQGFWSQVFHGKVDKVARQYRVNVRALTEKQTRVAVVDQNGALDTSPQARRIMALLTAQLR